MSKRLKRKIRTVVEENNKGDSVQHWAGNPEEIFRWFSKQPKDEDLLDVKCPKCGSKNVKWLEKIGDLWVLNCKNCNAEWLMWKGTWKLQDEGC